MRYALIVLVLGVAATSAVLVGRRQPLRFESAAVTSHDRARVAVEQQIVVPRVVQPLQGESGSVPAALPARHLRAANTPEGRVRGRGPHALVPSSAFARLLLGNGAYRPQPFPRPSGQRVIVK